MRQQANAAILPANKNDNQQAIFSRMNINKKIIILIITACLTQQSVAQQQTDVIPAVSIDSKTTTSKKRHTRPQTTTFQQQDIEQSPSVDLAALLAQQQSTVRLTESSRDSSQTAVSIRGFGDNASQNSLILVDGFPLTNASLLSPNFNSIPLTDIERVEIYQGSKGTLWGNQAVGGVMNIVTRHPEKFFANSITSLGSYHAYYVNVLTGDKFKNGWFAKVMGVLAHTNQYRHHNQSNGNNIALQAGKDDAKGTTLVNLQSYEFDTNFPGALSLQQMQDNPRQAVDFSNFSHYRTQLIQLLNKHAFSDDWLLETRLSQQTTNGDGRVGIDFTMQDRVFTVDPRLIVHWHEQKITLGYLGQINHYQLQNAKIHARTRANENDLYLQLISPLSGKIDFTLGARQAWQANSIDSDNTLNQVLVSEQGIAYHFDKTINLYIRRDGNFSFPKGNAMLSAQTANIHLNTQTGVSYETGVEWTTKQSLFQANLYQLDLHHELAFNPEQTPAQPFGAWNNLDDTRRYGLTLADQYKISDDFHLNAQINYVNARFTAGAYQGKRIPAVPAVTGNAGASYRFHDDWAVNYFLTYTGSSYASNDLTNSSARLASYWLNHLAVQYDKKDYITSLEVNNIFNQTYSSYAAYSAFTHTNTYYPAAGRNVTLTLKVNIA